MAKSILDQLIEKGKVVRSWLGVYIQNVTPEIGKQFGYEAVSYTHLDVYKRQIYYGG